MLDGSMSLMLDALGPANPDGGLVYWRNILIHSHGIPAPDVYALADEWKREGCPQGNLGQYAVEKGLIREEDLDDAINAFHKSQRLEVIIDEDESAGELKLPETIIIPGFAKKLRAGLIKPGAELDSKPDASGESAGAPTPPPKPVLPVAVEESLQKRGVLPGQTNLIKKDDAPEETPASKRTIQQRPDLRPQMQTQRRVSARRPTFGKSRRTQRLVRKTVLFEKKVVSGAHARTTRIEPIQAKPSKTQPRGLPAIGTKLGDVWLTRLLGQGGVAVVYQALHAGMRIPVAVKILKPHVQELSDYRASFRREAALTANLSHPNIVCVIDFFELDGRDILVLEYVDGLSLDLILKSAGRITPKNLVAFTINICDALREALNQGIMHRDLKPANFLLSSTLDVKISDFGLASLYNPLSEDVVFKSQSGDHAISGTPIYIAPEQSFPGAQIDHRADIYSLGVSMYQMLAGRPPFVADNPAELIFHHRETTPPKLADVAAGVPEPLCDLVDNMLLKNPDDRPYDYTVIKDALTDILSSLK